MTGTPRKIFFKKERCIEFRQNTLSVANWWPLAHWRSLHLTASFLLGKFHACSPGCCLDERAHVQLFLQHLAHGGGVGESLFPFLLHLKASLQHLREGTRPSRKDQGCLLSLGRVRVRVVSRVKLPHMLLASAPQLDSFCVHCPAMISCFNTPADRRSGISSDLGARRQIGSSFSVVYFLLDDLPEYLSPEWVCGVRLRCPGQEQVGSRANRSQAWLLHWQPLGQGSALGSLGP